MIEVKLNGRLGNQLFQYAFAHNAANRLKTQFVLGEEKNKYALKYFNLNGINKKCNDRLLSSFSEENYKTIQEDNLQVSDNSIYEGFYQSVIYFRESEKQLKNITIKLKYRLQFYYYFKKHLFNPYIAVHVRKTDYVNIGQKTGSPQDLSLPKEYFVKCFDAIDNLIKYKIIFVSDDINWARKNFIEYDNAIFMSSSEINDFQVLLHAKKLIIANSSFSWWAAFLNKKCNAVFAPKYWMGYNLKIWKPHNKIFETLNWKIID